MADNRGPLGFRRLTDRGPFVRKDNELFNESFGIAEEIKEFADVNDDGTITLYHRTNKQSKEAITKSGRMIGKEDGLFFTTKKDSSQAEGFGSEILTLNIPMEVLQMDDIFDDEAHFRIPLDRVGGSINVSDWLVEDKDEINWKDAFKLETDRPLFDNILDKPYYHRKSKGYGFFIVLMPPESYFFFCDMGHSSSFGSSKLHLSENLVNEYVDAMKKGDKFPMLSFEYTSDRFAQEGRHRAAAATKAGIDLVPVMVLYDVEDENKIKRAFTKFKKIT